MGICLPGCQDDDTGSILWLYWDNIEDELMIGNAKGWKKSTFSGAQDACLEATHSNLRPNNQYIGSLGAYKKTGNACPGIEGKTIARYHVALLQALGVQRFTLKDESHFLCSDFLTLPLRIAAGMPTLYESIYGGPAIKMLPTSCAEKLAAVRVAGVLFD